MDVNQFLARIQVTKTDNCLQLLKAIHRQHLLHIPFENLDIHLGRDLSMNPEKIFEKIVINQRGGLCFETNSLLYAVLKTLGYEVDYISASFWNEEKQAWNDECTHLALHVRLNDQSYLVDVGIGGGFFEPLLIQHRYVYIDSNGTYRVVNQDDRWLVQERKEKWEDLFKFSLKRRELKDFEAACHYYEQHPESFFRQKKICSRSTESGKISLSSNTLKITTGSHKSETPILSDEEFNEALEKYFQIVLHEKSVGL
ncbi:arylamine N-acetyltransferase [Priestia megaterium]|nr:arylamine N-acetyltransferase [Priestia megaterium]